MRTTRIRFDGYKKDWKIPSGYRTVTLEELNIDDVVYIIGTRRRGLYNYVPKAYGRHSVEKIDQKSGAVELRSFGNNQRFTSHVSEILVIK